MSDTKTKPWMSRRVVTIFASLVACLTFYRIHNHLVTSDPAAYLKLARIFLQPPGDWLVTLRATGFVTPGYPLMLAFVMRIFGDFAPYYLNLFLSCYVLWAYGLLVSRISGREGLGALTVACFLWFMFFGQPQNPNFMLYPFRSSPMWCFVLTGLLVYERALYRNRSAPWLVGGGLVFLAAVLVRETAVFALSGAFLACLCGLKQAKRLDRKAIAWISLPFLGMVIIGLGLSLATGRFLNYQVQHYLRITVKKFASAESFVTEFLPALKGLMGFIPGGAGWWGVALLLLGLYLARRQSRLLLIFLLPAVLNLVFYATYRVHVRYFFDAWFFLAPFLALGCEQLIRWMRKENLAWTRWAGVAVLSALLGGSLWQSTRAERWGPFMSRSDMRTLRGQLKPFVEHGPAFVENNTSYFTAGLVSYSNIRPGKPGDLDAELTGIFFQPRDPACFQFGAQPPAMSVEKLLAYRYDLVEVEPPLPRTLNFAGGTYKAYHIQPWTQVEVERSIKAVPGTPGMLWVNLGANPSGQSIRMTIRDGAATSLVTHSVTNRGWLALALDLPADRPGPFHLALSAERPIPAQPDVFFVQEPYSMEFYLEGTRGPAEADWFREGLTFATLGKYGVAMREKGVIRLPRVLGSSYTALSLRVSLSTLEEPRPGLNYVLSAGGKELRRVTNLQRRRGTPQDVILPLQADGRPEDLHLLLAGEPDANTVLIVNGLSVRGLREE